jgi:hypothetical protein
MTKIRKMLASLMAILLFVLAGGAMAQETTATVTGQVTDSAGAVVADAEVTLTNLGTRETRTTKSGDDGYYSLTFIVPGFYDLSIKAQGFKEHQRKAIELFVNDRKTLNVSLEPGAVTESVLVTAETPIIQSAPTVGDVIDNARVVELPLNNRNFTQLVNLVPGVTDATEAEDTGLTATVNISINGTRRNSVNWLVDGVSNTDVGSSITLLSVPTVDSIQEFRVITSVPTAEFGRAAGGVVNLVTRGGTQKFHGGAYEFMRNDKLNANSFFNNAAGTNAVTGRAISPRPILRYNNFGWNLAGPVWIPKIYPRGGDRTFFFFSQEFRRIIRQPAESFVTVPTLREREGDFTQFTTNRLFDPLTGNEFTDKRIPANRIDPTALALMKLFPVPTIASLTAGRDPDRVAATAPNVSNTRQETMRVDHTINSNHRLAGRYTHDLTLKQDANGLFNNAGVTIPDLATTDTSVPGQILAVNLTSTFGSNIVNELSFNFSSNTIVTELVGRYTKANVSVPNNELFPENNSSLPPTIITGRGTLGASQLFDVRFKNFNPKDNLTWVRGSHTIKMGADVSWERKNENAANPTHGSFTFSGAQTARTGVSGSGLAFADFLLGRSSAYSEAERDVTNHLRFGRTEFYGQDTWKVRPNFQIDYGIRYQLIRQPYDAEDVLTAFYPQLYNPAFAPTFANVSGSLVVRGTGDPLNGIAVAGVNSPFGRRVQQLDKNNLAPRFGFSYSPAQTEGLLAKITGGPERFIIRGGYGIYYDQTLVGIVEQNTFVNPPFANTLSLSGTVANPLFYENPQSGAAANSVGLRSLQTTSLPFITPIVQQWNLTLQRQLGRTTAIEIGYTGSAGNHLIRPVDLNAPTPQEILAAAKGVAGCDPALVPTNSPGNCINLARPFKGYTTITDRQTTATSRYHGLISSFRLQPSNGLSAQVSYTFSKNITDATNDRDAADLPQIRTNFDLEKAVSRFDRTHVFTASYNYEIPFAKSGFRAMPVVNQILGGWQFAGITTVQSGLPLNRVLQVGTSTARPRGNRPNRVGDPFENIPINPSGRNPYFINPLAFLPTPVGEIGNEGRATLRFPTYFNTDLNVAKNWRWGESFRIQFRAEFFNIFNRTTFNDISQTLPDLLPTDIAFTNMTEFLKTGSTFGQFIRSRRPREIQFGLKVNF